MGEDISNKTLAALLAVAIVISLGGTLVVLKTGPSISGHATTGTAQVNITATVELDVLNNSIDFGSGAVWGNSTSATINSGDEAAGSVANGTWTAITDGQDSEFIIRNIGNVDLSITINASKNSTEFIGGGAGVIENPLYQFSSSDRDHGSYTAGCQTGQVTTFTSFNDVPQTICSN